jgi:hypothetical protein
MLRSLPGSESHGQIALGRGVSGALRPCGGSWRQSAFSCFPLRKNFSSRFAHGLFNARQNLSGVRSLTATTVSSGPSLSSCVLQAAQGRKAGGGVGSPHHGDVWAPLGLHRLAQPEGGGEARGRPAAQVVAGVQNAPRRGGPAAGSQLHWRRSEAGGRDPAPGHIGDLLPWRSIPGLVQHRGHGLLPNFRTRASPATRTRPSRSTRC